MTFPKIQRAEKLLDVRGVIEVEIFDPEDVDAERVSRAAHYKAMADVLKCQNVFNEKTCVEFQEKHGSKVYGFCRSCIVNAELLRQFRIDDPKGGITNE